MKKNSTTPLPELPERIAVQFSYAGIQEKLQALSDRDPQSGMVDLVVMGRFKAGKSTLINSILQKPLLPVGVLPVTAIITRISYAAKEKARVTTQAGESFDIKTGDVSLYVSESNNPENEKEVLMPLHQSSNEALQSIYSYKPAHIKALTLTYLNITLNVRQKEADARNNLKQKIMGEQLKLNEIKQELQLVATNYKDNTRKM